MLHGYHTAGGDYGSMEFACDGKQFAEWETGNSGGYVVDLDDDGNFRHEKDRRQFLEFRQVWARAAALVPYPDYSTSAAAATT